MTKKQAYIPQVGDSVVARRKVKSSTSSNTIVGPIVETWPNACRIVTNPGTDIEGNFKLVNSDWTFQFLHKSIQDVAWNQFVQQLEYKAEDAGAKIVFVNPKNTTKMCSSCGKLTSKELSDRIHECSWCGLIMDRDLNASKNILRIGMDSLRDRDIPIEAPTPLG